MGGTHELPHPNRGAMGGVGTLLELAECVQIGVILWFWLCCFICNL